MPYMHSLCFWLKVRHNANAANYTSISTIVKMSTFTFLINKVKFSTIISLRLYVYLFGLIVINSYSLNTRTDGNFGVTKSADVLPISKVAVHAANYNAELS